MPTILHINASLRYAHSESLCMARHVIDAVQGAGSENFEAETLDLFNDGALPAFGRIAADAKMAVFSGQDQTPEQIAAWASARSVFDQSAAADAYVFNIPMWNAGVPYVLKQMDRHHHRAWLELRFRCGKGLPRIDRGKADNGNPHQRCLCPWCAGRLWF